jgi:hypothetical protein
MLKTIYIVGLDEEIDLEEDGRRWFDWIGFWLDLLFIGFGF